jgi:hypothetical protein
MLQDRWIIQSRSTNDANHSHGCSPFLLDGILYTAARDT